MSKIRRKQTIKEWELETGVKVIDPKGFRGTRNEIREQKYSKKQFRYGAKRSYIRIENNKGIDFMEGKDDKSEQWRSYIKYSYEIGG